MQESVDTGFVPEGIEAKIGSAEMPFELSCDDITVKFTGYVDRYDLSKDADGKVHLRTIDYKSGNKKVDSKLLLNGTQIQLPAYSGAIFKKHSEEFPDGTENVVVDNYGYVLLGLSVELSKESPKCLPQLSKYNNEAMKIAMDYSKHIIEESVDQIADGKSDAIVTNVKGNHCAYCSYRGYCGNIPSSPKCKAPLELDNSKYKSMIDEAETKNQEETDLDAIAYIIGGDKKMDKPDKIAILAMKDILENEADKSKGKEE